MLKFSQNIFSCILPIQFPVLKEINIVLRGGASVFQSIFIEDEIAILVKGNLNSLVEQFARSAPGHCPIPTSERSTPLLVAAREGSVPVVKALLESPPGCS